MSQQRTQLSTVVCCLWTERTRSKMRGSRITNLMRNREGRPSYKSHRCESEPCTGDSGFKSDLKHCSSRGKKHTPIPPRPRMMTQCAWLAPLRTRTTTSLPLLRTKPSTNTITSSSSRQYSLLSPTLGGHYRRFNDAALLT
jgi:hypothetical protein